MNALVSVTHEQIAKLSIVAPLSARLIVHNECGSTVIESRQVATDTRTASQCFIVLSHSDD